MFEIRSTNQDILPNGYYANRQGGFYSVNGMLFSFPAKVGDTSPEGYTVTSVGSTFVYTKDFQDRTLNYHVIPNRAIQIVYISPIPRQGGAQKSINITADSLN
jgi:hypothetical protein